MTAPWTAALWALAALACAALALGLLRLAARLAPLALTPTHRALVPATAALGAAALVVPAALGAPLLSLPPLARLGLTTGPGAALSLFALGLALTLALLPLTRLAFSALRPRDPERSPVPASFALLGVAPDGQALEHLRRPLRHATLLVLALAAAGIGLADPATAPTAPAAAAVLLVGLAAALAPSRPAPSAAQTEAAAFAPAALDHNPAPAFHAALGHPPRLATAPETPVTAASWPGPALLAAAPGLSLALAGPPGSGRRSAALTLAAAHPERPTLWLGPTPRGELNARLERLGLAPELLDLAAHADLEAALAAPRRAFGLIVVEAALARSGEAIAALRYGLHRLAPGALEVSPRVLVLGDSPGLLPLARALLATEPTLIDLAPHRAALPTRPTERYLLPGPPHELPPLPPATSLAAASLGPPALHPPIPGEPPVFRAYLHLPGGPRGRRLRELLAAPRPAPAPRHLLALPGDREVPEARERLARHHLRRALAEGPQRLARLEEVFSPRLVRAELAALRGSGRLVERPLYLDVVAAVAPASSPGRPATLVSAHLPDEPLAAASPLLLREPRSGRALAVPRETAVLEAYEGARVTLDGRALEVALGVDGERLLVPTQAIHATPIRRLRLAPLAAEPALSRHRFRGERELEVRAGRFALGAVHHGVRRFADAEGRSHTTLAAEPRLVPPTPVEACVLALPEATEAGLHALVHAVREALPLLFVNHADLGVTSARADELGTPALVLWDRHAEGLGAAHDLAGPDLERLLAEAHALLDCACPRHCARCCESIDCTQPDLPLDRHEARRLLEPLLTPRAAAPRLRSTA